MTDSDQEFKRWALGVIAASCLLFYGVQGLILRNSFIPGRHTRWVVTGSEAVAVSLCYLSLAIFLHVYFFWENRDRLAGYREALTIVSLVGFLANAANFVYLDFRS
jgi:hypothetical protein